MFKKWFGKKKEEDTQERAQPDYTPGVNTDALRTAQDAPAGSSAAQAATPAESEASPTPDAPGEPVDPDVLRDRITDMMKTIFDPEIPVNIYDIGLIYEINPKDDGMVHVKMTLTTPNCPAAGILPGEVESKTRSVEGVRDCELELTFDPPWNPDMMSEAAKLELGMM